MQYKLIVTDMDGTLLNRDQEMTSKNREAIDFAIENGVRVALASGRMYDSAKQHIEYLNMDIPIIACNGSLIKSSNGTLIYSNKIDTGLCLKAVEVLEKYNVYYQCQHEDLLFCKDTDNKDSIYYKINEFMKTQTKVVIEDDLKDSIINNDILKFTIIEENNTSILPVIKEELETIEGLKITSSWENNIEIMSEGVDKGQAIKMLCEHLNIDKSEIMAFGDNYNDIEMLEYAGLGVAMGNSNDDIKEIADYVTDTNEESGFANAIFKFMDTDEVGDLATNIK
ncbi:HAD family hydrolase [Metaclostridioides mangenotii]|uniref:Cof subfamily protein (Haloacid dehalogenase superfamily) n=1 Tax=Metaclostridioides mangenotii TaxID=1540 RepID=A0ABS4EE20_9FIRM|nr:HAD family hydrolase [Clostridioides mangenotii]MBP1856186.1 Cof subfamily protein (haloacid dehalogenase superfamily) [Clostridioides mangenotii]